MQIWASRPGLFYNLTASLASGIAVIFLPQQTSHTFEKQNLITQFVIKAAKETRCFQQEQQLSSSHFSFIIIMHKCLYIMENIHSKGFVETVTNDQLCNCSQAFSLSYAKHLLELLWLPFAFTKFKICYMLCCEPCLLAEHNELRVIHSISYLNAPINMKRMGDVTP
jgi:hypothetical protein